MADWGGIISGALQGGAQAVGTIAQGAIEDERRVNVAQQLSQMDEEKQKRISEYNQDLAYKGKLRETDRNGDLYKNQLGAKQDESDIQVAAHRQQVKNNADVAAEDQRAFGTDKARQAGVRAEANAKETDSMRAAHQASAAQASVMTSKLRQEVGRTRDIYAVQDQLAAMAPDDPGRGDVEQKLSVLMGTNKSKQDLYRDSSAIQAANAKLQTLLNGPDRPTDPDEVERIKSDIEMNRATIARLDRLTGGAGRVDKPRDYEVPTAASIDKLRSSPDLRAAFDKKFGPGASDKYLNKK